MGHWRQDDPCEMDLVCHTAVTALNDLDTHKNLCGDLWPVRLSRSPGDRRSFSKLGTIQRRQVSASLKSCRNT